MNCDEANEKLGLYLHNKLSQKEKRSFEEHLERCDKCSMDVKIYNKIKRLEDKELSSAPFPDVVKRAMDKIATAKFKRSDRKKLLYLIVKEALGKSHHKKPNKLKSKFEQIYDELEPSLVAGTDILKMPDKTLKTPIASNIRTIARVVHYFIQRLDNSEEMFSLVVLNQIADELLKFAKSNEDKTIVNLVKDIIMNRLFKD